MNIKEKLYKPFSISSKEEDFLFWGCLHSFHDPSWETPLWRQRGCDSSWQHVQRHIINWNFKANKNTIGFLLGDSFFGQGGAEKFLDYFDNFIFKEVYLCGGNHTAGFHQALNNYTDNDGNFTYPDGKKLIFMPNYFEGFVNGQAIVFSHYPILSFNGQGKNSWMLYAHVHNNLSKSEIGNMYINSNARTYEVSVENNSYPINFRELKEFFKNKSGESFDHHSKGSLNPFG